MCIIDEMEKIAEQVEYRGYYYKLSDVVKITTLGLLCQMKTLKEIHFWAIAKPNRKMLFDNFKIRKIPCYSHFVNLFGLLDSNELNKIFMDFFGRLVGEVKGKTIAVDGKTICSTANMQHRSHPLHIASAFVVENGITIGQLAVSDKRNEISAVQSLISLLDIEGATVVADALNCQKDTVKEILTAGCDYVLSVKKNHPNLYEDIADIIDFKINDATEKRLSPLLTATKAEKGHGRIEKRTAYVTHEIEWLNERDKWENLKTIGAISTGKEIRYYISSRILSPEELLLLTRQEWAIESMHWQLDVLFGEDRTTLHEENAQKTLNMLRKVALNIIRSYRDKCDPKSGMVDIMRKSLHDSDVLLRVLEYYGAVTN